MLCCEPVVSTLQRAEEAGEDYERVKLLEMSASDMERLERKKKRKNPDTGFAGELSVACGVCTCIMSD